MQFLCLGALTLLAAGCATRTVQPVAQTGPDAEMSFDGLVRLERTNFGTAWIKPDIELTGYNKIIIVDPEFEFRTPRTDQSDQSRTAELPLTDADKESLTETVHSAFVNELAKSQYYSLVTEPGPETSILEVRLLDVVALVPQEPDSIDGPSTPWSSSVGEGTLAIEVHDSMSGEILYRAIQRRTAKATVGGAWGSRVNSWAEIKPAAQDWGRIIRELLDQMHDAQ